VSVKAQVINLMLDLQAEHGLAYLFISHDMAVVERISHRVAVMYLGEIVEIGPRAAIFGNPQHPYTRADGGGAVERGESTQPGRTSGRLRAAAAASLIGGSSAETAPWDVRRYRRGETPCDGMAGPAWRAWRAAPPFRSARSGRRRRRPVRPPHRGSGSPPRR
jgi:hypothetical protein